MARQTASRSQLLKEEGECRLMSFGQPILLVPTPRVCIQVPILFKVAREIMGTIPFEPGGIVEQSRLTQWHQFEWLDRLGIQRK